MIGAIFSFERDQPSKEVDHRVDWIGASLVTSGLVLIVFVLGQGEVAPEQWATPYIIALYACIGHTRPHPFLQQCVLKSTWRVVVVERNRNDDVGIVKFCSSTRVTSSSSKRSDNTANLFPLTLISLPFSQTSTMSTSSAMNYLAGIDLSHNQGIEAIVAGSTIITIASLARNQCKWFSKSENEGGKITTGPTTLIGRLVTPIHVCTTMAVPVSYLAALENVLDMNVGIGPWAWIHMAAAVGTLGTIWCHEIILRELGKQFHYIRVQVALMSIISVVTILSFNLLRPKNKMIYKPKVKYHVRDKPPPRISDSLFGWLPSLIHTEEPELVDKVGLDAITFLCFGRLMRWLFLGVTILTCGILLPVNAVYNLKKVDKADRDVLSMLTIRNVSSNILFVHAAVTYLITFLIIGLVHIHWKKMVELRLTQVPKKYQSDEGIKAIFETYKVPYPTTSVHIGRQAGRLPELIEYHNATVRELETYLVKYLRKGTLGNDTSYGSNRWDVRMARCASHCQSLAVQDRVQALALPLFAGPSNKEPIVTLKTVLKPILILPIRHTIITQIRIIRYCRER
ncbi:hypothetical protein BT96DRAFT_1005987 [Gymnopus androsaceus JB14]|uniref:CSC1/OSCA1-like N-terminal transmembrane domain-containing protein n=1 Tax=Gymnopus androsaceus JB14 TaxID=1447944 RepID=A0A6A4GMR2_9AGAR|nr:hypothetical protein BT96DRAFT_1005987 [Gymnopus androsaceus JB14]